MTEAKGKVAAKGPVLERGHNRGHTDSKRSS